MATMREYWQHVTSGDVYAVELTEREDGHLYPARYTGPLHHTQVRADALDDFAYDDEWDADPNSPTCMDANGYRALEADDLAQIAAQAPDAR